MVRSPRARTSLRAVLTGLLALLLAAGVPGALGGAAQAAGEQTAVIDGTVAYPEAGPPSYGGVDLHRWVPDATVADGGSFEYVENVAVSTEQPTYSFGPLPAGTYYVVYIDDLGLYETYTYLHGGTDPPARPGEPGAVELAADAVLTLDLRPRALGWGSVVGQVTDDAGLPLGDIQVEALRGGEQATAGPTDAEGRFELSVPAGVYTLRLTDPTGEFEPETLTDVQVTAGDPTEVAPLVLVRARTGTVSGRILDGAGQPTSATVTLWEVTDRGAEREAALVAALEATAEGTYEFTGVPSGRRYTVSAVAPRHRETYLGGTTELAGATVQELQDSIAAGDLTMVRVVAVTGTVVDTDGDPLVGVRVTLHRWSTGGLEAVDTVPTDGDGTYALEVRPGGTRYTLLFDPGPSFPDLVPRWLGGGLEAPTSPDGPGFFTVDGTTDPVEHAMRLTAALTPPPPPPPPPPPVDTSPPPSPPSPVPPTAAPSPGPPAKATAVVVLKAARKKVPLTGRVVVKVTVTVGAGGSTAGQLQLRAGARVLARGTVAVGTSRTVTWRLRAKKLRPGTHRLRAVFTGNATTLGSTSTTVKVRVLSR